MDLCVRFRSHGLSRGPGLCSAGKTTQGLGQRKMILSEQPHTWLANAGSIGAFRVVAAGQMSALTESFVFESDAV